MNHLLRTALFSSLVAIVGCDQGTHAPVAAGGNDFDAVAVAAAQCVDGWLVSNVPRHGSGARVAFGPDGSAHLIYFAPNATGDRLLRHVDERTITDADTLPTSAAAAIAVAPDGTARVFVDSTDSAMQAFRRAGDAWKQIGASFGSYNQDSQPYATVDSDGRMHVSYADALLYSAVDDGAEHWSFAAVGPQNQARGAAVDVDAAGHEHLFYGANDPKTGGFGGYWTTDAGGAWKPTPFPTGVFAAADAVDNLGRPHVISLMPDGHHHLWYDAGAWKDELLTIDFVVTDLRIDGAGQLHLAGFSNAGAVTYANNVGGSWTSTAVSTNVDRPLVWLGLDASGAAHLAWTNSSGAFSIARRCN